MLKQGSYDAVHVNMCSAANMVPLRLAKEAGVKKIIAHSHNSFAPGIVRKLMDACNRSKIDKYATAKIACGKVSAQWLFGEEACANQEVTLIRNAIDVDKYLFSMENRQKLRREFDWEGKFVIGHVGRFDTAKNHEGMIPIFKEIVKRRPDAVLCLIGDGVLKEQIRARVKENGMEKNVFFAGVRDNVEEFLSAMDVFFFPSLTEGVPFTMVEAQANGLPCVASDVITDEVFLSEDGTKRVSLEAAKEDWAKAILSYEGWKRKDPKEIKETLGRAHFDIEKEADRLLALYQE